MIILILILIIPLVILISLGLMLFVHFKTQKLDSEKITNYFNEKIKDKDFSCEKYLEMLATMPTWRSSLLVGLITSLIILGFMFVMAAPLIRSVNEPLQVYALLSASFVFNIIMITFAIYKLLNHISWHQIYPAYGNSDQFPI